MATPLTRCVACWDELSLAELAHSPCKYCHVEFCNDCLTRAFEIAQRDDVLEVHCPNPHCKRLLNAESMQIQTTTIKQWVHEELTHRRYGVLDEYKEKNWDSADIVHYIINTRKRDLTHVRRKSSVWEDQLTKLKLRAKADLCDVPLAPTLYANASNDRIDIRSKFTSKMQRSQSVPNVSIADKKIQMFKSFIEDHDDDDDDDDELETDTDFSDSEEVIARPATATATANNRRLISAIIDEDEELNDCLYNSPMNSDHFKFPAGNVSGPSSPYDRTSPYMNSILSKKSSDMTMISISESSQSIPHNHTTDSLPNDRTPTNKKKRLSATFRAIFSNKAVSADAVKKKKRHRTSPNNHNHDGDPTRSRGHSDQQHHNNKLLQHRRRSGSNRILDIFTKNKKHKHKKPPIEGDKTSTAPKKELQKTRSSRRVLPRASHHVKSHTLTLEEMRSITPDPTPKGFRYKKRSNSQVIGHHIAPISPPPPQENRLSLSYQKQLIQFNIKNKKKKNTSHLSPHTAGLKKPRKLPSLVSLKSKSAPDAPPGPRLSANAPALVQLQAPETRPTPSSSCELSTSELSVSISGDKADIDMQRLPVLDTRRDINSNSRTPSKLNRLCLAPISSAKELDVNAANDELSSIILPQTIDGSDSEEEPHSKLSNLDPSVDHIDNIDDLDDMAHFDINAHVEVNAEDMNDADDESSVQIHSVEGEDSVNALEHVGHTFMTDATTNDTNTISNTMPMPASPNITPLNAQPPETLDENDDMEMDELPPVDITLLERIDTIDRIDINRDRHTTTTTTTEVGTPNTPPTPESPDSGSVTSNHSHYERAMRNMDAAIARQSIKTQTAPIQDANRKNNNDKHHHGDPPSKHDFGGCNGCHACVVL